MIRFFEDKMRKIAVFFLVLAVFGINFTLFAYDDEKLKLAVMEFEDLSEKLPKKMLSVATEQIRGKFVSSNKFIVIAKERQEKAMIKEMKKESYKSCNDKNCQIPLGQALSADTILRTTITFFGGSYTITSELIDLEKEATIKGAEATFDGSENSFKEAINSIVAQIVSRKQQKSKTGRFDGKTEDSEISGREEAIVNFKSVPAGAAVIADGKLLCKSTPCSKMLKTGKHKIQMQMEDNCFLDSESTIAVKRNQPNTLSLTLKHRESAIKVYAQDENGNDISADVFVDDKSLGKAPNTFKVPLCSHKLLVSSGIYKYLEDLSLKEKQVKTIHAKLESINVDLIRQRIVNLLRNLNLGGTELLKIAGVVFLLFVILIKLLKNRTINNMLKKFFILLTILLTMSAFTVWIANFFTDIGFSSSNLWIADIICLVITEILFLLVTNGVYRLISRLILMNGIILLIAAAVILIVNFFTYAGISSKMFWIIGAILATFGGIWYWLICWISDKKDE